MIMGSDKIASRGILAWDIGIISSSTGNGLLTSTTASFRFCKTNPQKFVESRSRIMPALRPWGAAARIMVSLKNE